MTGRFAPRSPRVPPLPPEDHRCDECGFAYGSVEVLQAVDMIRGIPAAVRAVVDALPRRALQQRPPTGTWSVTEYVCHLRDGYVTSTIRLHRARTEDRPVLEPMLNDLRARRFRYNSRDVRPVLDELADAVAGCCDEVARVEAAGWDRVVTRLPGEERTARWLVRHAAHEGVHHLRDLDEVARAVAPVTASAGMTTCLLCDPAAADRQFSRVRVWEDGLWRLSVVLQGPVPGFAHLEPKRHIPYVTDLDGAEAATFGAVLARVTAALREAAGADKTYAYVFGDHVAHLHVNLAPHRPGDALLGGPGLLRPDAAEADAAEHRAMADAVTRLLG